MTSDNMTFDQFRQRLESSGIVAPADDLKAAYEAGKALRENANRIIGKGDTDVRS